REREIAHGIERLVADELVLEAQAAGVENAVFGEANGVFERGAERIALAPELRDIAHKAEGAGGREFVAEGVGRKRCRITLTADQRMIEIDLDLDAETGVVREKFARGAALG